MDKNWYILYTKPGTEKKVAASLAKRGIEHYLPLCYKGGDNNLMGKRLKEPLFEGYVFVETTVDELIGIRHAVDALSVVYRGKELAEVPKEEIKTLMDFTFMHEKIDRVCIKVGKNEPSTNIKTLPLLVSEGALNTLKYLDELLLPSIGYALVVNGEKIMDEVNSSLALRRKKGTVNR